MKSPYPLDLTDAASSQVGSTNHGLAGAAGRSRTVHNIILTGQVLFGSAYTKVDANDFHMR